MKKIDPGSSSPKSSTANQREDRQNVLFGRIVIKAAVLGVDHGNADVTAVDLQSIDNLTDRDVVRILLHFRDEPIVAEVGEKLYCKFHLDLPARYGFSKYDGTPLQPLVATTAVRRRNR